MKKIIGSFSVAFLFLCPFICQAQDEFDLFAAEADSAASAVAKEPALLEDKGRWLFLLPAFVIHGEAPSGGANEKMPRKLDPGGRAVATPGFGFEYQGPKSMDALIAFVKDCYDHYAGTFQVGQYMKLGETTKLGYSLGLYIRETPIDCLTSTETVGGAGPAGPGGRGRPARSNSFSNTVCSFQDNLPWRYTTEVNGGYMDIIPSPFINFSTRLYHGSFDVELKVMTNYFLTEFGVGVPF